MAAELLLRDPHNPLLRPRAEWWEMGGVFNPAAALVDGRVLLLYRAVGRDHISRLGLAWSDDGCHVAEQRFFYEAPAEDLQARLGLEDPRLTTLEGGLWVAYTKVAVAPVGTPPEWQMAPFSGHVALARVDPAAGLHDERVILAGAKDGVLFPRRVGSLYHALVRIYPSLQIISSPDLRSWGPPRPVLEPRPGTWEAERIGAGPPPVETPWGWLLLYHANEFLDWPRNRRHYRVGLAVLARDDPSHVIYRHPHPVFEPVAPYETGGTAPNVVFPTGLIVREGKYHLYYGGGDSVGALATAPVAGIDALLADALS